MYSYDVFQSNGAILAACPSHAINEQLNPSHQTPSH